MDINFILQHTAGNLYWKDKEGRYCGANNAFLEMIGCSLLENIVGHTDRDLFSASMTDEKLKIIEETDKRIMCSGIEESLREEGVNKEGKSAFYITKKIPLFDGKGEVVGIMGTSLDITKEMQADIARTEFLENMSHDIRTPLTGIIGMSSILEQEVQQAEEKQHAHWINESGEQLLSLLNGVLDIISSDSANELTIHEETFDLRQTIQNIITLELPALKLKNLEAHIQIDEKIPLYIVSDRIKLHRILLNLLGNAIKFTEKGYVAIYINQLNNQYGMLCLEFSVSDTGIGIHEELQDRVFERFFRATPSYKGTYSGHGVGLHIAQKYVELLNGKIKLTSKFGEGTTFTFTLPLVSTTEESCQFIDLPASMIEETIASVKVSPSTTELTLSPRDNTPLDNEAGKPRLLLIEDNRIALLTIQSIVKKLGCQFISAMDGETALDLAKSHTFDLIVSDIGLPGISGYEFTEKFRQWEKNEHKKNIPIVGLTAHALDQTEDICLRSGMNKVITKPISLQVMKELLAIFVIPTNLDGKKPLGADLPDSEEQLFRLEFYSLLDVEEGVNNLGDKVVLIELLQLMVEHSIPEDMIEIQLAYAKKDWDKVENLAHKMKSGAVYCGTLRMKYACQYLERYRKAGLSKSLEKLYQQLIIVLNETSIYVRAWLRQQ